MKTLIVRALLAAALCAVAASPAEADWAIAQGKGSSPAVSRHKIGVYDAERSALQLCAQGDSGCRIIAKGYTGDCVAMAATPKGNAWGVGVNDKMETAYAGAVAQCQANGGGGTCRVVHRFCDRLTD